MSLLPLLLDELLERPRRPTLNDLYDQNFGLGLLNDEILHPRSSLLYVPLRSGYVRPWRVSAAGDSGVSNIQNTKDGFRVNLDVQQFKAEDLKVKVVDDYLVVEAKHEERVDEHGYVSRQFTRRYKLPADVDPTALVSKLSSDGVLTLEAPKKVTQESKAREIPITQTNTPALKPEEKKSQHSEEMDHDN